MSLRRMANVVSQYYFDAPTAQIIEPKRSALIFGYVGKPGWLTLETKNYVEKIYEYQSKNGFVQLGSP